MPPDVGPVTGFWEYDSTSAIVVVDEAGAGVLACADVPGDQLKHLSCPLGGPCVWEVR